METGDDWSHDTTAVNIDGTGALDFVDDPDETGVHGEWDEEYSGMYPEGHEDDAGYFETDDEDVKEFTDKSRYSSPRSYWMPETPAPQERLPVDMGIMIDTTGSMDEEADDGRTWMDHAIEATQNMIGLFDEDDRVALFNLDHHHKDAGSFLVEDFQYMTQENKDDLNTTVGNFYADGGTPLWDASGYTINHVLSNPRPDGEPGEDFVQATMLFTDGVDEHYSWGKLEGGSNQYAPGSLTGDGPEDHTWGVEDGHLWGQGEYEYENQDGSGSDVQRYYHESRAGFDGGEVHWQELEFRESSRSTERLSLMKNPTLTFTVALGVEPSAYLDPDDDGYMDPSAPEYPFTSEYQLIQIAESTDGDYYYTPDAEELGDIFEEIFESLPDDPGGIRSVSPDDTITNEDDELDLPEGYAENIDLQLAPYYRYTTTTPIDARDTVSQRLSFRTKYWMTEGTNGGFMYLWGREEGEDWVWDSVNRQYIRPDQSYTGNLDFDVVDEEKESGGPDIDGDGQTGLKDLGENIPYWCFNGKSRGGTFGWDRVTVNLDRYDEFFDEDISEYRVVFVTAQMGGISEDTGWRPEMGWYIDNVRVELTRDPHLSELEEGVGYWIRANREELETMGFDVDDHYHDSRGNLDGRFWMYAGIDDGEPILPKGVDSSLYTSTISLSNADTPVLNADIRFNFHDGGGRPPNGLRIEITDDDGATWSSLTYGVRAGWNYTGGDCDYSGESDEGGYGWVDTETLIRLNTDLSDWRGQNVRLRFRVFTNESEQNFYAEEGGEFPKPVFIDNVTVTEEDMEIVPPPAIDSTETDSDYTLDSYDDVEQEMIEEDIQEEDGEVDMKTLRDIKTSAYSTPLSYETRNRFEVMEKETIVSKSTFETRWMR